MGYDRTLRANMYRGKTIRLGKLVLKLMTKRTGKKEGTRRERT